jgi:diguanylate cyclase (GGDEF)-like protein
VRLRQAQHLRFLAEHDALTGARNRRRFDRDLSEQAQRARRYGEKAVLLMIDVNNFKQINDAYGHQAGDSALTAIASALRSRLRETDVVARTGGDEFAVLLPYADLEQAKVIAADLRRVIGECRITSSGHHNPPLSASIGIAAVDEHNSPDEVARAADRSMYAEKRQSRLSSDGADLTGEH